MLYTLSLNVKDDFVEAVCHTANLRCAGTDSRAAISNLTKAIRFYHQADNEIVFRMKGAQHQLP